MTNSSVSDMPDEVYVFADPQSIGDLGFTVKSPKDGHIKYLRADRVQDLIIVKYALQECKKYIESGAPYLGMHKGGLVLEEVYEALKLIEEMEK